MSLDIEIYPPVNGNQYVVLSGRLDSASFEQLDDALDPLLLAARPGMVLVLELAHLEYISSAGIRSILKARKALAPDRQGAGGASAGADPQGPGHGPGAAAGRHLRHHRRSRRLHRQAAAGNAARETTRPN